MTLTLTKFHHCFHASGTRCGLCSTEWAIAPHEGTDGETARRALGALGALASSHAELLDRRAAPPAPLPSAPPDDGPGRRQGPDRARSATPASPPPPGRSAPTPRRSPSPRAGGVRRRRSSPPPEGHKRGRHTRFILWKNCSIKPMEFLILANPLCRPCVHRVRHRPSTPKPDSFGLQPDYPSLTDILYPHPPPTSNPYFPKCNHLATHKPTQCLQTHVPHPLDKPPNFF